ncbi:MAG: chromosome partitioning protein ParB, partial [Devosiaceae bacterium]|nr:chromosome partitioning protein ParB [Devosiaceae bacterium]
IGKSRSHVANTLRLMKLPEQVQDMISNGDLTAGHARTLITSNQPLKLAKKIVSNGLSVRQAEALHQKEGAAVVRKAKQGSQKDANTTALEKRLSDALGFEIFIDDKGNKGRVSINYKSLEQLDDIVARLLRQ